MDFSINVFGDATDPDAIDAVIVYCDSSAGVVAMPESGGGVAMSQRPVPDKSVLFDILNQGGSGAFVHRNRHSDQDRDVSKLFKDYNSFVGEDTIRRFPMQPRCKPGNPPALKPLAPRQTIPECQPDEPG